MRGDDCQQTAMFSYLTLAQRIQADHAARRIRELADRALERLGAGSFLRLPGLFSFASSLPRLHLRK